MTENPNTYVTRSTVHNEGQSDPRILFRRPVMQDNFQGEVMFCCCQSIKLVDGKKKITGNTVKVGEACARLMFRILVLRSR